MDIQYQIIRNNAINHIKILIQKYDELKYDFDQYIPGIEDFLKKNDLLEEYKGVKLDFAMLIAGNSPNIEASTNERYRKDSFRDITLAAFQQDIIDHFKQIYPELDFRNFLNRDR